MDQTPTPSDDAVKRARVLDRAFGVFLSYGYKRVTMDDLARAADMSRPALYLIFNNKADIYRALGIRMFEHTTQAIAMHMQGPGTLPERLDAAIVQVIVEKMREVKESPHGAELLDLKNELAAGMVEEWRADVTAIFRDAIQADVDAKGVDLGARGLSAVGLAAILLDGIDGMKQRLSQPDEQRAAARQLVRVIELAISP